MACKKLQFVNNQYLSALEHNWHVSDNLLWNYNWLHPFSKQSRSICMTLHFQWFCWPTIQWIKTNCVDFLAVFVFIVVRLNVNLRSACFIVTINQFEIHVIFVTWFEPELEPGRAWASNSDTLTGPGPGLSFEINIFIVLKNWQIILKNQSTNFKKLKLNLIHTFNSHF